MLIPAYGGHCFADIPATVERLLTGAADAPGLAPDVLGPLDRRWARVVLVLVDAFGVPDEALAAPIAWPDDPA